MSQTSKLVSLDISVVSIFIQFVFLSHAQCFVLHFRPLCSSCGATGHR